MDPVRPVGMGGSLDFFINERGRTAPWSLAALKATLRCGVEHRL